MPRFITVLALGLGLACAPVSAQTPTSARSAQSATADKPAPTAELDAFMAQVLMRRDENWKKVQQYILDEQERVEFRGPAEILLWGAKREYMWYPRDGFFVRSPVRFNGVAISEGDRERYEQNFLRRTKERDERAKQRGRETDGTADVAPSDIQSLIQQTREPQFVSSAYLLKFKFEGGRYALVGRETVDKQQVLRIEYYPTRLFSDDPDTRAGARANQVTGANSKPESNKAAYGHEMQRLMNKVSRVTIWVEPNQKQIVKYTFENVSLDFLPASWLVRVTELRANMTMTEAFDGVWLPERIDVLGSFVLAPGPFSVSYDIQYSGYREAATAGKYLGPSNRPR
jgi:hypothetical protein